jgi:hypothetical protein
MKLTDLVPSSDTWAGLDDVEKRLQERRYTSRASLIVATVVGVTQTALVYIPKNMDLSCSLHDPIACAKNPDVILLFVFIVAALIWILYRYTGFLFEQSKEPFRYTFSISDFTAITSTPDDHLSLPAGALDKLRLLRYDLTERLVRRVRRFSLLEPPTTGDAASAKGPSLTSHFQIEGVYAIRKESDDEETGGWILHVWPRIRIGAEGNPFTLAFPVRLPLEDDEAQPQEKAGSLQYQRLVERVYSSVATEIYNRIEIDLRDKMTLFPTSSLRALARYIEAEDFETSNTIEAYDRALGMYRRSLDELKASGLHRCKTRLGIRWPDLVAMQWTGIRAAMESEAKTELGFSRCLIYRRLVSSMAGRQENAIFETRPKLFIARGLLRRCYNSVVSSEELKIPSFDDRVSEVNLARLKMADEFFRGPEGRRPEWEQSYLYFREWFCEAFAVSALALCFLADSKRADSFRQLAESLQIGNNSSRLQVLLLIVRAELEPRLPQKLDILDKARGLDPESEIVLYRFAYYSDLLARDNDELTEARVEYLNEVYEAVLKVNPASIAALISQGYLFWLVDKPKQARKKLDAGIELQKIVTQTFVGDLKYCLARVRVELAFLTFTEADNFDSSDLNRKEALRQKGFGLLRQAAFDYEEATIADPTVAAAYAMGRSKASYNVYYEFFNSHMLSRYRDYARQVGTLLKRDPDERQQAIVNTIRSYALNDYGIAGLYYYLRFEVCPDGDAISRSKVLRSAVTAFEASLDLSPNRFTHEYNLYLALTWAGDDTQASKAEDLVKKSGKHSPESLAEILPTLVYSDLVTEHANTIRAIRDLKSEIAKKDVERRDLEQKNSFASGNEKAAAPTEGRRAADAKANDAPPQPKAVSLPGSASGPPSPQGAMSFASLDKILDRPKFEPGLASDLRSVRTKLSQMQIELGAKMEAKKRSDQFFEDIEKSLLNNLAPRTALAPYAAGLKSESIDNFLNRKDMKWSTFGDIEVSCLTALAQIWAYYPKDSLSDGDLDLSKRPAGLKLCQHVVRTYYPEHFNLNIRLLDLMDLIPTENVEQRQEPGSVVDRLITGSLQYDSRSNYLKLQRFERFRSVSGSDGTYDDIVKEYENAKECCQGFASFHDSLAVVHESEATKLAKQYDAEGGSNAGGRQKALEVSAPVLQFRSEARRLEPTSKAYRDRFLTCLGRQWIAGNPYTDPLAKLAVPRLIEVEVATDSVGDLRLSPAGLPDDAQEAIKGLRAKLVKEVGLTLPGVNFRDDRSLERGQFRLLVRGAPLPVENLRPHPSSMNWDTLTKRIEDAARSSFWSVQDCDNKLLDMSKDGAEYPDIRKDPDFLFALSWVLKSLLRERAPTADFQSIVKEFQRCRSRGLGLIKTVEEIRLLPKIRRELSGNSPDAAAISIDLDLENRILAAIDISGREPIFNQSPQIAPDIRLLALKAKREADEKAKREARECPAVLITGPEVRPFVRKTIEDLKVAVISSREAIPALLMRA